MTTNEAIAILNEAGAVNERKEDREGVTRRGWWLDMVWLSADSCEAVRLMRGA